MDFNVGDKVRRKAKLQSFEWELGDMVLTVSEIHYPFWVRFQEAPVKAFPQHFELVEPDVRARLLEEIKECQARLLKLKRLVGQEEM